MLRVDQLDKHFPRYTLFDPAVPIWCITPNAPRTQHRFFDTSPISPSGRYAALTRFPFEDHPPEPGDVAEVVLVDLAEGITRIVAETTAWEGQLGAQTQWGATDGQLFFNVMDTSDDANWRPHGVCMNVMAGAQRNLQGTVYMVSRNGLWAVSPCLKRTVCTQGGYGVLVPLEQVKRNEGAPDDDGVYLTDCTTGECKLLVSMKQFATCAGIDVSDGSALWGFHAKITPQNDRIGFVVRQLKPNAAEMSRVVRMFTMRLDGSELTEAITADQWSRGGHHPDFTPDGRQIIMNLKLDREHMRFVAVGYDGRNMRELHPTLTGSGHPSLHPRVPCIVTDSYLHEPMAFGDGTTPIRWCNLQTGEEVTVARIHTQPDCAGNHPDLPVPAGGVMRVDPHPAWDRSYRYITFNACPNGERQVFVADMQNLIDRAG